MGAKKPASEWLFGLHTVLTVLQTEPERVLELRLQRGRDDERLRKVQQRAERLNLPVTLVNRGDLDRMVDGSHQGVAALCRQGQLRDERYLWQLLDSRAEEGQVPFLLVLDGITDPHNLGACLRTADAAGVWAVLAPKDRSVGMTPVVQKVASGAAESVPFIAVTNLARTLDELKSRGVWLVGTAGEAEQSVYEADLKGPVALVMGAEGSGLRRLTRDHCDFLVKLPMAGVVSSLNVSVAAGVCLFEAVRQRGAGD